MGQVKDLRDGLTESQEIIQSGQAIAKLREWVRVQNSDSESGLKKLERLMEEIDVRS
jgi:anthranilate phosphoribosyltransferase